jgi:hypothetical protein
MRSISDCTAASDPKTFASTEYLGARRSGVEHGAGAQRQGADGLDPGLHVGEQEPDALVLDDRQPAAAAVGAGEPQRDVERRAHDPGGARPEQRTTERGGDDAQPVADLPDHVRGRHVDAGEGEPRQQVRAVAERVEHSGDRESLDRPGRSSTANEVRGSVSSRARQTTVI